MLNRREWGGLLLFTGCEILLMLSLIINFNFMHGEPGFAQHFSYMQFFSLVKIPVLTLGLLHGDWWRRATEPSRREIRDRCLFRHAVSLALALVPGAMVLLAGAKPIALWYVFGYALMDAALLGLFMLVASLGRRRVFRVLSFLAAWAMLVLLYEAPSIALKLRETRSLIGLARALMALSPFALLSQFTNGLVNWQGIAILLAMAVLPTWLVIAKKSALPPKWQNQVVLVALALGIVTLYGLLPPGDLTTGRYATPAKNFFEGISGLDDAGYEIDVTLVAPVTTEDPWIDAYLQMLDARSSAIAYHLSDPNESDALLHMNLAENTILVEGLHRTILVTPERIYPVEGTGEGERMGFGLEGTIRAALAEASGGTLTADPPDAFDLTIARVDYDGARTVTVTLLSAAAILALSITGLILMLKKKRHER